MERTYHRKDAEQGPVVLERLSDLDEAKDMLGDFKDITGMKVVNPTGDEVGRVDQLYMDPKRGKVAMASITFGGLWGFGAKRVLVPMDQLELADGGDKIRVLTTPEIVRCAPELGEGDANARCHTDYWEAVAAREREEQME